MTGRVQSLCMRGLRWLPAMSDLSERGQRGALTESRRLFARAQVPVFVVQLMVSHPWSHEGVDCTAEGDFVRHLLHCVDSHYQRVSNLRPVQLAAS